MIKAALFDLDGVVFDTEHLYTQFWQAEGRRYHPEIADFAQRIKGQTLVQIYEKYFDGLTEAQSKITQRLVDFEKHMDFVYVGGLVPFVSHLRLRGIKLAIVTSSDQSKMGSVYAAHPEINHLFDHVFTAEDFTRSKPDPECYLKGARFFGVEPAECVGFEDSFNGLKSVRAAGMTVVGLATTNPEEAIRPYCDIIINDYTEWTRKIHLFT